MSGTETYGGKCPHCEKPMLQKWDSSPSALLFDACVHCGFIYGTFFSEEHGIKDIDGNDAVTIWGQILNAHSQSGKPADVIDMLKDSVTGEDVDDFYPSIFDYSNDSEEEIKGRIVDLALLDAA